LPVPAFLSANVPEALPVSRLTVSPEIRPVPVEIEPPESVAAVVPS
jgi:hypothetical protein